MTFAAGQPLTATDLNMTPSTNADPTARTTTSIAFTTTLSPANICGVAFVAPPTGKVMIFWNSSCANGSSPNIAQCSPSIRTGSVVGSGSVFQASDTTIALTAISSTRAGASTLVTGLTPGDTYNVALEHRSFSAGTSTFQERDVTVVPQIA